MREQAIAEALRELDRWQERERQLAAELRKAEAQVAYYESLLRDMKRDVKPARIGDLLRAF